MNDDPSQEPARPATAPGGTASPAPAEPAAKPSACDQRGAAGPLTPEEQMALFEKDLKENDWGHQPC